MIRRPTSSRETGLFASSDPEPKPRAAAFQANIDGGSRGNPGPASYGVVVRNQRGEIVAKLKKYIGRMTNNVAEYYGLIAALDYAQSHGVRALRVESDSELLVRQMRGHYKVKSPDLRPLFERAKKMSQTFESFRIDHVYREQNAEADALANEALDETSGKPKPSVTTKPESRPTRPGDLQSAPRKLRAQVRNGGLHLLEPLDLPENTEVEILLRPAKS
ncbi:MAG TPA: reverse transcriptase-like protein [Candidatus Acidoferrum sp.]|jgi:ribonuclease HI|nr:reverse transcriptase-like protein [Candidatus Acidoferrum sp.]